MAMTTLRSVQRLRFEALGHAALLATALLGSVACGDEGTGEYAGPFYDGAPGTAGALYRPLRPATTPGVAGSNGVVPGAGGAGGASPGVAGAPGFAGRAGAGGLGGDPYGRDYDTPYSSAGSSGSSPF